MPKLTESQVLAAGLILQQGFKNGSVAPASLWLQVQTKNKIALDIEDYTYASEFLVEYGFIKIIDSRVKDRGYEYMLTDMGDRFINDGKNIQDFLAELEKAEIKQHEQFEAQENLLQLQIDALKKQLNRADDEERKLKLEIDNLKAQKGRFQQQLIISWGLFLITVVSVIAYILLR